MPCVWHEAGWKLLRFILKLSQGQKNKTFEGNLVTICSSFFPLQEASIYSVMTTPTLRCHAHHHTVQAFSSLFKPSSDLLIQKLLPCSSACWLPSFPDVGSFWTLRHLMRHGSKGSTPFVLCVVLERAQKEWPGLATSIKATNSVHGPLPPRLILRMCSGCYKVLVHTPVHCDHCNAVRSQSLMSVPSTLRSFLAYTSSPKRSAKSSLKGYLWNENNWE